jgi:hypothetical protein
MEEWKEIQELEGYEVSNLGKVRSLYYRKKTKTPNLQVLKPARGSHGYPVVNLKQKTYCVHRLVAEAFLPNPDNLPCIDHKDRDRTNNLVSNLHWVSYSENLCNKKTKSGHHHIHLTPYDKFAVRFSDLNICKNYNTLEEAINARDEILSSLNQSYSVE